MRSCAWAECGGGAIHHVGIRVEDLRDLVARMQAKGVAFHNEVREFGWWRYIMCAAPDGVLLELFEIDTADAPDERMRAYFKETGSGEPSAALRIPAN